MNWILLSKPGLSFIRFSISSVYPASIMQISFLWSSISFINVAMASSSKPPLLSDTKLYASSINSTPPIAFSTILCTFCAVHPTNLSIKSLPWISTNSPLPLKILSSSKIFPIILAILVFPVPGFPVKHICSDGICPLSLFNLT